MNDVCTITRYYGNHDEDLDKLWRFIDQAQIYSSRLLIGVNIEKDQTDCIKKYSQQSNIPIDFIPIQPWIGISTPLNILLNHIPIDHQYVLIQSAEIQCTSRHIACLRSHMTDNDDILCVGAALDGHQTSDEKYLSLRGDTSPWNTLAIWNLKKLRRTGFPLCADLVNPSGMEDAITIALQQKLFGGMAKNRALLIRFDENVPWSTQFNYDENRRLKHQVKMSSKNSRTKQLLQMLDIEENQVGVECLNDKC
ncbi:unnamed protein product [Adineta ricciae]|uniref:Uncharacterized protein n=1 Tax=Adineta ricciae TaxID=249248 RepID=A0A813Q2U7_ADIRI|nr:unnamed protein product [Adineta ricciae]